MHIHRDDALMKASNDVTDALRRTLGLMQSELERSVLSHQILVWPYNRCCPGFRRWCYTCCTSIRRVFHATRNTASGRCRTVCSYVSLSELEFTPMLQ